MNKQLSQTHERDLASNQPQADNFQKSINSYPHEMNTSEGGEFLDDAIRTEDQLENTDMPTDEISLYVSQPFNEPADPDDKYEKSLSNSRPQ